MWLDHQESYLQSVDDFPKRFLCQGKIRFKLASVRVDADHPANWRVKGMAPSLAEHCPWRLSPRSCPDVDYDNWFPQSENSRICPNNNQPKKLCLFRIFNSHLSQLCLVQYYAQLWWIPQWDFWNFLSAPIIRLSSLDKDQILLDRVRRKVAAVAYQWVASHLSHLPSPCQR
jgi:hypothetical protein